MHLEKEENKEHPFYNCKVGDIVEILGGWTSYIGKHLMFVYPSEYYYMAVMLEDPMNTWYGHYNSPLKDVTIRKCKVGERFVVKSGGLN